MFLKLNGACQALTCSHVKCDNCKEEDGQERDGEAYLLSTEDISLNEALRKQETHQAPISPTLGAASSSVEYADEALIPFDTLAEPINELGEAPTRECTPHSDVEPQDVEPKATVFLGNPPLGDNAVFDSGYSQSFSGGWGEVGCSVWGPNTHNTSVVTSDDWTLTSGHLPYTDMIAQLPGASYSEFHSLANQSSAYLPSAVYSSPCEYHEPQQNLDKKILSQEPSPRPYPSKDTKACNSCLSDAAVLEKPLACVFYKYNPEQYSSCMQKSFRDIGALGQHLKREHHGKLPTIPKVHQKSPNWKWYWIWGKLFGRYPPPKCPYLHPKQDMKAHIIHQFFRDLGGFHTASVDVGRKVQTLTQHISSSQEPLSDSQFMDTLHTWGLTQPTHYLGVYKLL